MPQMYPSNWILMYMYMFIIILSYMTLTLFTMKKNPKMFNKMKFLKMKNFMIKW